jgi:Ni2+-binding GTPase involved in maturation of urease and hydrogenase
MTPPVLFGCVGGFLGAGKTSALLAATAELRARGLSVGIVTNDQGADLVDTGAFRARGLPTAEVPGGCFCCRFDDLVAGARQLLEDHPIDVLLAEAVGSCTDLVATVYRPLRRFLPDAFRLAPFSVLVEPDRVVEMTEGGRVPSEVAYVFDRQLAEADLVVVTKADTLEEERRPAIVSSVAEMARGVPVLETSAVSGDGIAAWVDRLLGIDALADRSLEVDYDRYARGEAALAWLNAALDLRSPRGLVPRSVGEALLGEIAMRVRRAGLFVAHVKTLVATSRGSAQLAFTRADGPSTWSGDPDLPAEEAVSVLLNARVVSDPPVLSALVEEAASAVALRLDAALAILRFECFAPRRPVPRHRLAGERT